MHTTLFLSLRPVYSQATAVRVYTKLTPASGHHFTHQSNRGRKQAEQSQYLINSDKVKSTARRTRLAIIMINVQ